MDYNLHSSDLYFSVENNTRVNEVNMVHYMTGMP